MDKQAFEANIQTIESELVTANDDVDACELELINVKAKAKELRRRRSKLMAWGVAMGFVSKPDILPEVTKILGEVPITSAQIADALDADVRTVAGALRRGVSKGLVVPTDEGYILAVPEETTPVTDVTDVAA